MYKITKEDVGQKIVVKFVPNINNLSNHIETLDVFMYEHKNTRHYSYIFKDGAITPFVYGHSVVIALQKAMMGQYLTDDGRLLNYSDDLSRRECFSYYEFEDGEITMREPFGEDRPYRIKESIYTDPYNPFDLTSTKALEITVGDVQGFLKYDCRWVDVEPLFDGTNKEYCLALYNFVQPLTDVIGQEKMKYLEMDSNTLFDADAIAASKKKLFEKMNNH